MQFTKRNVKTMIASQESLSLTWLCDSIYRLRLVLVLELVLKKRVIVGKIVVVYMCVYMLFTVAIFATVLFGTHFDVVFFLFMSNWTTTSGNRPTEGKVCNWVNVVACSGNLCASCVVVIHNFFIHQSFALKASSGLKHFNLLSNS